MRPIEPGDRSGPDPSTHGGRPVDIQVLTIFPQLVEQHLEHGMLRIARDRGVLRVDTIDVREHATDRYRSVDDYPYGGGPGMVMSPVPLVGALAEARRRLGQPAHVVLLSAQGRRLDQEQVAGMATRERLVLVCGRYKGIDERFIEAHVDEEISLGDFVLSGGEIPALALIEATARLLPGVLGNDESAEGDSFACGLLEGPLYTRPEEFEGRRVPEQLLSGHHARIAAWRRRRALERTLERRPDLLRRAELTAEELEWLERRGFRPDDGMCDEKQR
jgi:tRNA (guanine37-N1)-methyltransferase